MDQRSKSLYGINIKMVSQNEKIRTCCSINISNWIQKYQVTGGTQLLSFLLIDVQQKSWPFSYKQSFWWFYGTEMYAVMRWNFIIYLKRIGEEYEIPEMWLPSHKILEISKIMYSLGPVVWQDYINRLLELEKQKSKGVINYLQFRNTKSQELVNIRRIVIELYLPRTSTV